MLTSQKMLSLILVTIIVLSAAAIITTNAATTTGQDAHDRLPNGAAVGYEAGTASSAAPPYPTTGAGHTYYVSPTGRNSNDGSFSSPWATPGYGSKHIQPGDTLIIRGGRYVLSKYFDDQVTPPSGNATAWTTVRGETGNRPILVGRDNLLSAVEIDYNGYLKNNAYLSIENLEITSDNGAQFRDGVWGGPNLNHVVLKDLYIHHVDGTGIGGWSDVNDLKILNCTVTYCGGGGVGGPTGVHGGWRNVVINHCNLSYSGHYYQGGPISPDERPDAYGVEPSNGPIEIAYTTVTHNRGDGIDSKSNNTYIHHCIVANNNCDHVKLWGTGSTVENTLIYGRGDGNAQRTDWAPIVIETEPNARVTIANVAVDDALGGNYLMAVNYPHPERPISLTVTNTIFNGRGENSPIFLGSGVNFTFRNNLFWMPNTDHVLDYGATTYTASQVWRLGQGNKYGNPLYVSPAWGTTGNYHLKAGSPAIDAGTPTGAPSTDLDGKLRPQGKGYDIGAYEYPGKHPTTLTATAPATAYFTKNFTIKGRLTASGVVLGYQNIILQRSLDAKTYTKLTTRRTNSTGWYQFSRNEATVRTYYYRTTYAGSTTTMNATSNVLKVMVKKPTSFTISTTPAKPTFNKQFTITGALKSGATALVGLSVHLERKIGSGSWTDVTGTNKFTGPGGAVSVQQTMTTHHTYSYRWHFTGTATYQSSYSLVKTCTV